MLSIKLTNKILQDPNYRIEPTGEIFTRISRQGHLLNDWVLKFQETTKPGAKNNGGYKRISYCGYKLQVHRIVYAAHKGKLRSDMVINHIDGNPANNHIDNLEQITHAENVEHSYRVLKNKPSINNAKLSQEIADEIRNQVATENKTALEMAHKYNVTKSTIYCLLRGKTWTNKAS